MDGLLDIVSTVTKLQSKQFVQLLEGYDIHQSFSQRVSNSNRNFLNISLKKYLLQTAGT